MIAWRLVKEAHAAEAFSGEGARRWGGRWNEVGTSVVYASDSLALAALEVFVHLGRAHTALRFVALHLEIADDVLVESRAVTELPANWREEPPPESTRAIGTEWVRRGTSAVLRMPSIIVPVEHNLVLNPAQAQFRSLRIGAPQPFSFDSRLWK